MINLLRRYSSVAVCIGIVLTLEANHVRAQDTVLLSRLETDSAIQIPTRDIIEAVMDQHIAPPTRQQLVLEVIRTVAKEESTRLTADVNQRVSAISDVDELYDLLATEIQRTGSKLNPAKQSTNNIIQRLSQVIPGGIQIVPGKEHKVNEQLAANRYVGIGVQVSMDMKTKRLRLMKVFEGGTADEAGLQAGDVIMSVDGMDTHNVSITRVVNWLRGPEGSTTDISVKSRNSPTARDIKITRRIIPLKTATLVETSNSEAAMIRLERITASTVHELRKLIRQLPDETTTVILDLRSSPQHTLHYTHLLADALLEEAELGFEESRSGLQPLITEAGSIFDNRRLVLMCRSQPTGQIAWLASIAASNGIAVYRDPFERPFQHRTIDITNALVYEAVSLSTHGDVMRLATRRLLTNDKTVFDGTEPVGKLTSDANTTAATPSGTLRTLWNSITEPKALSGPQALVVTRKSGSTAQPQMATPQQQFAAPSGARWPTTDDTIIQQILSHESKQSK